MKIEKVTRQVLSTLLPVLCTFFIGEIIIIYIGENPLTVYGLILKNTLLEWKDLIKTPHFTSLLILAGLAIGITFKANTFNMGVKGQMLGGAFTACILGLTPQELPSVVHIDICLLADIVCGVLLTVILALLKTYLHVDEMVVILMLNYAVIEILRMLSQTVHRGPTSGYMSTPPALSSTMINRLGSTGLMAFFPVMMVTSVLMYLVFNKPRLGYEIRSIGRNPGFAEAGGVSMTRKIVVVMFISGAPNGFVGSDFMLSGELKYTLDFSDAPGPGWDGMLISLLDEHSPIDILVTAIFYSALKAGSDAIGIFMNISKEIVGVTQGLLILFLSIRFIDEHTTLLSRLEVEFLSRGKKEVTGAWILKECSTTCFRTTR